MPIAKGKLPGGPVLPSEFLYALDVQVSMTTNKMCANKSWRVTINSNNFSLSFKFKSDPVRVGTHRSFGTHVSRIQSVNLDLWPEGKAEAFKVLNNRLVNSYWEANLPSNFKKPGPNASGFEVNRFLSDKYIHRKYVD